jgi:hypothetical protein
MCSFIALTMYGGLLTIPQLFFIESWGSWENFLCSAAIPNSHRPSHCSLPVPFYSLIAPYQAICFECLSRVINIWGIKGPGIWCWFLGESFPTFWAISLPSYSTVISILLRGLVTLEDKGKKVFETSGSFHPTIQCHIPATLLWEPQISYHYQFWEFWVLIRRSMCCTMHSLTNRHAVCNFLQQVLLG